MNTYHIKLRGLVDVEEVNRLGPQKMDLVQVDGAPSSEGEEDGEGQEPCTTTACRTDQSGMIGVLRHLHNLGYVVVSILRLNDVSNKR